MYREAESAILEALELLEAPALRAESGLVAVPVRMEGNHDIIVWLQPGDGEVLLYCHLGEAPPRRRAAVATALAGLNRRYKVTFGMESTGLIVADLWVCIAFGGDSPRLLANCFRLLASSVHDAWPTLVSAVAGGGRAPRWERQVRELLKEGEK